MRDRTLIFGLVVVPLLGVMLISWLSATATYTATWQGERLEVNRQGRWLHRAGSIDDPARHQTSATGIPKAVAESPMHDFGTMDPLTMGQHAFVIRNEGTGPLKLGKGPTTCKCTLSNLSHGEISPGEEGVVVLQWNSGRDPEYSHEATIYTSDPDVSELHFKLKGKVRQRLAAVPPMVSFGGVEPDGEGQVDLILYSQVWDSFDVVGGTCSVDGVTWTVAAVTPQDAILGDVRSARKVTVTIGKAVRQGDFSGQLRLEVQPHEGDIETLELPLDGQVLRRLAVYGPSINMDGVINLGQVDRGESKMTRMLLKIRDPDRQLDVTRVVTHPGYLRAAVVPYQGKPLDSGLMHLELEVPADAPACSYLGVPLGNLHIEFDHPRIPSLDLRVKFAVVGRDREER